MAVVLVDGSLSGQLTALALVSIDAIGGRQRAYSRDVHMLTWIWFECGLNVGSKGYGRWDKP